MAIYHFSGAVISRSAGKSAIASAAYRSGEKLYDERQEKEFDYSRKQDVLHKEVMLPEGAPKWMADRERLWNVVEAAEKRKDAQLSREIHFSLPRELSNEQNIELAKEFVKNEFVWCGMVADLCIHDGKTKDGEEQPHAHVMLTLREVTEEGFGLKDRSWNAKENMLLWRESWAEHANKYLALNDIEQRIDHRSLAERGIDLIPQNKIGPVNLEIHEQKLREHQKIARENGEKILEDPSIALKGITYHQSTFTHQDLARFINRNTVDAEQFQLVYEKVKNSEEIVALKAEDGVGRFSTKEMLGIESRMVEDAVLLKDRASIGFKTPESLDDGLSRQQLSLEQKDALGYIIGSGDVKCLVGYAGTGKSFLLNEAREIWESQGYTVYGATLSGIAAENLEGASGIESKTLASRFCYWDMGREHLTNKDVLVIDEAGMLGSRQIAKVLEEVKAQGAKAVLIGDPQQLQAIEAGAAFRAIAEQTGFLELTEVRRQQKSWQQEATKEFALRHTQEAIGLYEQHGNVHEFETQAVAKMALVEKWNDVRTNHPEKTQIMLTYTRRDAQELNEMARSCRKENNELGEDQKLQTSGDNKDFAIGDKIYFLRNNKELGVKNGTLGVIEDIRKEGLDGAGGLGQVTIRLEQENGISGGARNVTFDLERYNHITHGYAATIHKAQGVTVDQAYVLASKHFDSHAAYVGMSRHRESVDLYWSKEEFSNKKNLENTLSRDRSKDVTLDYIVERDQGEGYKLEETTEVSAKELSEEKSVAELLKDIMSLGKGHGQESSEQQHLKELRDITQQAERSPAEQKYLNEIKEYLKQAEISDKKQHALAELKVVQSVGMREQTKDTEIMRQEISPQERRAEKLIEEYHKHETRYHYLEEHGGSRFSTSEAKNQMDRCAHELCHDKHAMESLQKNDRELFKEMNQLKELEKMREMQRDLEMSL
jgi:Ti-type conjugative transfer relaxase TraA